MTGDNLTDVQLQQIVNRTILYLDQNSDGKIGMQEFIKGKIPWFNDFDLAIRCSWDNKSKGNVIQDLFF